MGVAPVGLPVFESPPSGLPFPRKAGPQECNGCRRSGQHWHTMLLSEEIRGGCLFNVAYRNGPNVGQRRARGAPDAGDMESEAAALGGGTLPRSGLCLCLLGTDGRRRCLPDFLLALVGTSRVVAHRKSCDKEGKTWPGKLPTGSFPRAVCVFGGWERRA